MLYKQAVSIPLLNNVVQLMKLAQLNDFCLVGGTALALQLGHRFSIDIDLFTNNSKIDLNAVERYLKKNLKYEDFEIAKDKENQPKGFVFYMNNVKVDLHKWPRQFTEPSLTLEGIRMATLKDISILKLDAIKTRIHKKDFIDLYFLFRKLGGVQVVSNYLKESPTENLTSLIESLNRVEGAMNNKTPMPTMLLSMDESHVVQFFQQLLIEIQQRFEKSSQLKKEDDSQKQLRKNIFRRRGYRF